MSLFGLRVKLTPKIKLTLKEETIQETFKASKRSQSIHVEPLEKSHGIKRQHGHPSIALLNDSAG